MPLACLNMARDDGDRVHEHHREGVKLATPRPERQVRPIGSTPNFVADLPYNSRLPQGAANWQHLELPSPTGNLRFMDYAAEETIS